MSPRIRPRLPRALVAAGLAAALATATVACSSDDGGTSGESSLVPPVSVTAPASTSTDPDSATTTLPEAVGAPDAASAALTLYNAWVANDQAAAATVAEPEAIEAVWAAEPGPYELYRGCDTGEFGTGGCLFRDRSTNHTIQLDMEKRDTGWVVTGAFYSTE